MLSYPNAPSAETAVFDTPTVSISDAHHQRANSAKRAARDCILLACVTSPGLAAELIDRAIVHYRNVGGAIAAIAHNEAV